MTAVVEQQPRDLWQAMPGWGIVADLLPPEIVDARRVKATRRLVAAGAVVVVVLAILGYAYAYWRQQSANDALARQQAITSSLTGQQARYDGVVQMQGTVVQVQGQVSQLMASDVDVSKVLTVLTKDLPPTMSISQLSISLDSPYGAGAGSPASGSGSGSTSSIDASGHKHIGSVTLAGSGQTFSDIATYVEKLSSATGLAIPYPVSSQTMAIGVEFSLDITLTDQLLTHRYDPTKSVGK